MRTLLLSLAFLYATASFGQTPVLVVNRIDKFTKELIKQTSMYPLKDGSGNTRMYFSVQSTDDQYALQLNVPQAVTIKKGSVVTLSLENGKHLKLTTANDIISISESDVNKRMMVCSLNDSEKADLLKLQVNTIRMPTANKGEVQLNLLAKDRPMIRTAMALVGSKGAK